jgi:hypothetical protein
LAKAQDAHAAEYVAFPAQFWRRAPRQRRANDFAPGSFRAAGDQQREDSLAGDQS